MQTPKSQRDVPPGPLAERTLERWIGVDDAPIPLVAQRDAARGNADSARDEPAPHWSSRIETWFFRFAVVAAIAAVIYAVVSTLLWFGFIR